MRLTAVAARQAVAAAVEPCRQTSLVEVAACGDAAAAVPCCARALEAAAPPADDAPEGEPGALTWVGAYGALARVEPPGEEEVLWEEVGCAWAALLEGVRASHGEAGTCAAAEAPVVAVGCAVRGAAESAGLQAGPR